MVPDTCLGDIAAAYDVLLCDVFLTLHDADGAFPDAVEALRRFRAGGRTVVLVSNSALPGPALVATLGRVGIGPDAYDCVVTSADLARELLARSAVRAILHLGPVGDRALLAGLAVELTEAVEAADVILCTGWPTGPAGGEPPALSQVLEAAAARGLELICTNPDRSVEVVGRVLRFAGLVAERYAALGGRVLATGKPDPSIYRVALAAAADRSIGRPAAEALVVGDGLALDVAGAFASGLDALWITETGSAAPAMPPTARLYRATALRW